MELEEQWWKGQLAADIYQSLRSKELELPPYKCQSAQLHWRRYFVDLLAVTGNHFRLCPAVRHLAVYLLDLFMDCYNVTVQELHIVSLTCLVLASKFEGVRGQLPSLEKLNSLGCMTSLNLMLTEHGLLQMEVLLLQLFQWNLCLPTAAHFIDYVMSIAVHEGDLHDGWPMTNLEEAKSYMTKYADYFLEVSLQDHVFLYFPRSLVAAACVASSRLVLHLFPTWPPRLELLTGYTWADLLPCVEKLLIAHDGDFKEAHKQNCQQQQQEGQTGYHSAGQPSTVAQYLSLSGMQYPEQTVLMDLAPDHRTAFYLG